MLQFQQKTLLFLCGIVRKCMKPLISFMHFLDDKQLGWIIIDVDNSMVDDLELPFIKLFKITITWQKGTVCDDMAFRFIPPGQTGFSQAEPKTSGDHVKYYEIPCSGGADGAWKFGVLPSAAEQGGIENNMPYTITILNNAS
ncbi:MAG: hypothetical protein CVU93_03190 [Firmicutes bacterium HGW-Firmicutes-18]|nr:MAG: hypothetical protein CVU93_03190 [Firmicutes bacterium HGW-Firmicutes-18]